MNSPRDSLSLKIPVKQNRRLPEMTESLRGLRKSLLFVSEHGRQPRNIEGNDIFERLYATRLNQIRKLEGASELLAHLDKHNLLSEEDTQHSTSSELDSDTLLAELEVDFADDELTTLTHVRSAAEKRAAEEIANRTSCSDFDQFEPLFKLVQEEIKSGQRLVASFGKDRRIEQGDFFILSGQTVYVAHLGDEFYNQATKLK